MYGYNDFYISKTNFLSSSSALPKASPAPNKQIKKSILLQTHWNTNG